MGRHSGPSGYGWPSVTIETEPTRHTFIHMAPYPEKYCLHWAYVKNSARASRGTERRLERGGNGLERVWGVLRRKQQAGTLSLLLQASVFPLEKWEPLAGNWQNHRL